VVVCRALDLPAVTRLGDLSKGKRGKGVGDLFLILARLLLPFRTHRRKGKRGRKKGKGGGEISASRVNWLGA